SLAGAADRASGTCRDLVLRRPSEPRDAIRRAPRGPCGSDRRGREPAGRVRRCRLTRDGFGSGMAKRRTKAGAQQGLEDAPLMPTGALAVALLAFAEGPGPVVHVARDARRLEDLAATLRALEPDARVAVYPEWDCLPFDHASPSRATMGARAAVMRW